MSKVAGVISFAAALLGLCPVAFSQTADELYQYVQERKCPTDAARYAEPSYSRCDSIDWKNQSKQLYDCQKDVDREIAEIRAYNDWVRACQRGAEGSEPSPPSRPPSGPSGSIGTALPSPIQRQVLPPECTDGKNKYTDLCNKLPENAVPTCIKQLESSVAACGILGGPMRAPPALDQYQKAEAAAAASNALTAHQKECSAAGETCSEFCGRLVGKSGLPYPIGIRKTNECVMAYCVPAAGKCEAGTLSPNATALASKDYKPNPPPPKLPPPARPAAPPARSVGTPAPRPTPSPAPSNGCPSGQHHDPRINPNECIPDWS